jgi:hypothetical protein
MTDKKPTTDKKAAKDLNKSEEIRKLAKLMLDKNEKPRPVLIIAALKKQGIEVSSPQVSMVLKRMGVRPRRRKAGPVKVASVANVGRKAGGAISVEELIAAKRIVSQLGGTDRALAAISALKRFES